MIFARAKARADTNFENSSRAVRAPTEKFAINIYLVLLPGRRRESTIRLVALPGEIQGPRREAWEDLDEVLEVKPICAAIAYIMIQSAQAIERTGGKLRKSRPTPSSS